MPSSVNILSNPTQVPDISAFKQIIKQPIQRYNISIDKFEPNDYDSFNKTITFNVKNNIYKYI